MRTEINPNADYATRQAQRAERQGDIKGAQWYRNARWSSYQRQVQGKSTHLRIDE